MDSLIKRLTDREYARKFTPRKPDSKWSTANRRRYTKLKAAGLLTAAGLERSPTERSYNAPRPSTASIPAYIERGLRENVAAWQFFQQLAPSYQRLYVMWIEVAKRDETKRKRLGEAIELLAAGKKLGLK